MKYLCFDIESCDGGKNGSLCSFGYCVADENFNILDQDDIIVNPKKSFNKRLFGTVIKLAYTEEVFRSAPRFPNVYDRIKALFDNDVVVLGFSVINDVNYLSDAIRTYGLEQICYDFYDVQLMYGIYKRERRVYSLMAAATEFDIDFLEHRSLDDAVASLKVLKGILAASGLSFNEFIDRYGVMPGKMTKNFKRNCYTDFVYSDIDYSNVKIKKKLLNEFINSTPRVKSHSLPFSHKVLCFDDDIELNDINLTRDRLAKLFSMGGRYTSGVESSNVFVYENTESARYKYALAASNNGHKLQFLPLEEFLSKLGEVETHYYDDCAILSAGNRRKRINRERAQRCSSRQKGTAPAPKA